MCKRHQPSDSSQTPYRTFPYTSHSNGQSYCADNRCTHPLPRQCVSWDLYLGSDYKCSYLHDHYTRIWCRGWRYLDHLVKMACCCIRACNDDTEKKITINTSNNQRLWSAGDNDRRSKRFCSNDELYVIFTWQMVKTRVIRLRVIDAHDQIAFCAFHSFLAELILATYMQRMRNNNPKIRFHVWTSENQSLTLLKFWACYDYFWVCSPNKSYCLTIQMKPLRDLTIYFKLTGF